MFSRRPRLDLATPVERRDEIVGIVLEAAAPYLDQAGMGRLRVRLRQACAVAAVPEDNFGCSAYIAKNLGNSVAFGSDAYASPWHVAAVLANIMTIGELPRDGWPDPAEWRLRNV